MSITVFSLMSLSQKESWQQYNLKSPADMSEHISVAETQRSVFKVLQYTLLKQKPLYHDTYVKYPILNLVHFVIRLWHI